MNPLQYINKIFCTLLFFSAGNKSYSQREIHPLEPMFTYDYALKYYLHKPVRDFFMNEFDGNVEFWMIENFKSLPGVSSIEQQFLRNYRYDDKYLIFRNAEKDKKYKYFYNAGTGFLEKSHRFQEPNLNNIREFINLKEFIYFFDEQFTTIEVNRFVDEPAIDTLNYKYVYENVYDNLIKIVVNKKDTIHFSYADDFPQLVSEIKVGTSVYKAEFRFLESRTQNHVLINSESNKRYFPKKQYEETSLLICNIRFEDEKKNIYGFTEFNGFYINSSNPDKMFLFDSHQKLIEYHESTDRYKRPDSPFPLFRHRMEIAGYIIEDIDRSIIKKSRSKWIEFLNVNKYSGANSKSKKSKEHIYKIKNGDIYMDGIPIIIFKYNSN